MSKKKILIVEDETIIAMEIGKDLELAGYTIIETVVSGEKALDVIQGNRPDLVLMDINLQGEMDGIEAAENIANISDIPVIFLTAFNDEETFRRAKATSPYGYIMKPVNKRDLETRIEIALHKHLADKEISRRAKHAELIYQVGMRLTKDLDLERVFQDVVDMIHRMFLYSGVHLFILYEERSELVIDAMSGDYTDILIEGMSIPYGKGMIGTAAMTGNTQVSGDVSKNPVYVRQNNEKTRSELSIPLKHSDKIVGVLDIQDRRPDAFDVQDVHSMEALSTQIAAAIENARLFRSLQDELSERRKIQKSLEHKRSLLSAILDSTADGILVVDNNHKILHTNPHFCSMWKLPPDCGASMEKTLLQNIKSQLLEPESFLSKVSSLYESGKEDFDTIYFKDGRIFERYSCSLVHNEKIIGRVWSFRDVTERKEIEDTLKKNEKKYRTLFNQVADPVVIFDRETYRFLDCNIAATRIYGYSVEELRELSPFDLHPAKDYEEVKKKIDEINRDRYNSYTHVTKYGRKIDVKIKSEEIIYQGRHAQISVIRDVTEEISKAEELRTAKEKAEETARQLDASRNELEIKNVTLERALAEAEKATRIKSEFLANISHELRTPMNGIIGMAELAYDLATSDEQKEYLAIVQESSDNLLALLNNLLDFSKIEAERVELEQCAININMLAEKLRILFSAQADKKDIELSVHVEPDVPTTVTGDRKRLEQVLQNLLHNGVKFTEKGSVDLRIRVMPDAVQSSDISENERTIPLYFSVRDTGVGIPADMTETIFESFVQSDGSMTRKYGGTGLGLAICRELVELMGGEIWVDSEEGKGSDFQFYIHFKSEKNQKERVSAPKEYTSGTTNYGLNVLVAEDNEISQTVITQLLEKLGCRATIAENGKKALDRLRENTYDMIFMDVQMPEMNGLEAVRELRDSGKFPNAVNIPVVALTAHAYGADHTACLNAGMDYFLTKPVTLHMVEGVIRKIVCGDASGYELTHEPCRRVQGGIDIQAVIERMGGQENLAAKVYLKYMETVPGILDSMEKAVRQHDLTQTEKYAHSLKSACANIGADEASSAAAVIEKAAREKENRLIKSATSLLRNEIDSILAILQSGSKEMEFLNNYRQ